LEQNDLPLLKNTVVDTMQISRAVNTGLKHHNLGIIARSCHINYDEMIAHRADVDVSVLHGVWKNLAESLKRMGIETFNQINTKLQNESLRSHQFGDYQLVYCKTQKGIKDIYRLVSISCTVDFYNSPRVIAKNLYEHRENLIVVNSPNDGDV
jgi:DNA polymerase-3 subunit alpha (Gram-positive type)